MQPYEDERGFLGADGEFYEHLGSAMASFRYRSYPTRLFPTDAAEAHVESADPTLPELLEPIEQQIVVPTTQEIVAFSSHMNERLWTELQRDPTRVRDITPRQLEELVADLFSRDGYEVELTPASRDGGRDVIAVTHNTIGKLRYIAECKHFRPDRKVGVEFVRSMYGVLEDDESTWGLLVTTSSFTTGAQEFATRHEWRIGLKAYEELLEWLQAA